jgi:2-dehydro-3-deoxyglucarate aldolase/4-hydroxy-2-oxoheptanedioate aldolase
MARAPWNDLVTIKRMLDCGLQGIHIPYVNNFEETVTAVRACKYPPLGNRGNRRQPQSAGYGANRGQYLHRANDELLVS